MTYRVAAVVAGIVLAGVAVATLLTPPSAGPPAPTAQRTRLYVHCGIDFMWYADRWWHADPEKGALLPLPDAQGITHDDGYLDGTVTPLSPRRARFISDDGRNVVEFEPTTATPPPCD